NIFEVEENAIWQCRFRSLRKTRGHLAASNGVEPYSCLSSSTFDRDRFLRGADQFPIFACGHKNSFLHPLRGRSRAQLRKAFCHGDQPTWWSGNDLRQIVIGIVQLSETIHLLWGVDRRTS